MQAQILPLESPGKQTHIREVQHMLEAVMHAAESDYKSSHPLTGWAGVVVGHPICGDLSTWESRRGLCTHADAPKGGHLQVSFMLMAVQYPSPLVTQLQYGIYGYPMIICICRLHHVGSKQPNILIRVCLCGSYIAASHGFTMDPHVACITRIFTGNEPILGVCEVMHPHCAQAS